MTRVITILFAAFIALQGAPAAAQGRCGDRAAMVREMDEKYGEVRRGFGMANGVLIELWASSATGTFTILQTYTTGVACVVVVGRQWQDEDWQAIELRKEPKT